MGGKTLDDLWKLQGAHDALRSDNWDYVVIQDMSVLPSTDDWTGVMHVGIVNWDTSIKFAGSHTVLYETWARKPGSDWYNTEKYPDLDLGDPTVMQEKVDQAYKRFSTEIGSLLVPAGDYWAKCRDRPDIPDLYMPDATHPSVAGTYLTALVFYAALTGNKIEDVSYKPLGMSSSVSDALKSCASDK